MKYVTDLNEIFRILSECCGEPVYTDIGADENGNRICVPMYTVGEGSVSEAHTAEKAVRA